MYHRGLIFYWLVLNVFWKNVHASESGGKFGSSAHEQPKSTYNPSDLVSTSHPDSAFDACTYDDFACLSMAASDKLGLDAIKTLHKQLDDDEDGNIDYSESDDFLKEELKYDSGAERRQKAFHRNNDMHISVKELWEAWLRSEVHNWTIEQTTDWLTNTVNLPQYIPNFVLHRVTGANLPRLAVNNANYLAILGIKDPIHKQKVSLKAMDVVLFGPPKDGPTWKDITLILLIIVGVLGSYYAYHQNKKFRRDLTRMNKDMDSLQNAEKALENLQKELEEAKQAQESVISEKINLEKKLQDTKSEYSSLPSSYSDLEVSQLKAEIEMLRTELQIAEGELKDRCWAAPAGLQQWLQLTHEIENKAYLKKRLSAEKQLQQAREACEKLRKKRSSLVGAFVSTHGKSIDEVDRSIVEARTSLNEVTQELQERVHRWKQIEMLCGFNIINNNGLQYLENTLYRNANGRSLVLRGRMSSTDDLDDDTGSMYGSHGGCSEGHHWKDGDSSSSETSKLEDEGIEIRSTPGRTNVQFLVGDGEELTKEQISAQKTVPKLSSNPKSASQTNIAVSSAKPSLNPMTRSVSHDTNILGADTIKPKASLSDTALENKPKPTGVKHMTIQEQPSISVEDDICSTDSSLMDEGDIKKKRRKLFTFSKKSKNRAD